MAEDKIHWRAILRAGWVQARLRPDAIWALTPAEFLLLCWGPGAHTPSMSRARLEDLIRAFPDPTPQEPDHG